MVSPENLKPTPTRINKGEISFTGQVREPAYTRFSANETPLAELKVLVNDGDKSVTRIVSLVDQNAHFARSLQPGDRVKVSGEKYRKISASGKTRKIIVSANTIECPL